MRLRQKHLKQYYVRPCITVEGPEGSETRSYGVAYSVMASIQPLEGTVIAQEYGVEAKYMKAMRVEKLGNIKEGDGVCVYVESDKNPDYIVDNILPYTIPFLTLKKV